MIRLILSTALMNFGLYVTGFFGFDIFTSDDELLLPILRVLIIAGLILCIWGVFYFTAEKDGGADFTAALFVIVATLWVQLFSWPWELADLVFDVFSGHDYLLTVLTTYLTWIILAITLSILFLKRLFWD